MEKQIVEVLSPSDISCFSHPVTNDEVTRDSLLGTIDNLFDNGSRVIVVSGEEGIGKTVLLSQFVRNNKAHVISLFIDAVNAQSYFEDNIIQDLYRQLLFYINGDIEPCVEKISLSELNSKFYLLETVLKKNNKNAYIVIDGLSCIPEIDHYIVDSIINFLPFSFAHIKFLISSDKQVLESRLKKQNYKPLEMTMFSDHEAMQLFPDVDSGFVRDVKSIFHGKPEVLITIKRLIDGGMRPSDILQQSSENTESLYAAEWERSLEIVNKNKILFGLITFAIHALKIEHISKILGMDPVLIENIVDQVGFIELSNDSIRYLSAGIKHYAMKQLQDVEIDSLNMIVTHYSTISDEDEALTEITSYHERLQNYPEIIEQLSNTNISLLFKKTSSINEAIKQIKIGKNAAINITNPNELLRLCQAQTILSDFPTSQVLNSELMCYLTEDDYESAMKLMSSVVVIEEKLHLLSTIASFQKKKSDQVDPKVEQQIVNYFSFINPEHLGVEKTVKIATDLFTAFPEMSLSLINKIEELEKGGGNKADYAFFKLSLDTLSKSEEAFDVLVNNMDSLEEKKRDTLSTLGLFKKGTSADKIISKIETFESPSDAIFILKSWISSNPKETDNFKLVDKIISLVISTSDYYANASLYADLVIAIKYMNKSESKTLLSKIKPKLPSLKLAGPTLDYVKLEVGIVHCESQYENKNSGLGDLIDYIFNGITDSTVKLSSLLHLVKEELIDSNKTLKQKIAIEIDNTFEKIVSETADHVSILKNSILSQVEISFEKAVLWCKKLNTRPRRDCMLSLVVKEACKNRVKVPMDVMCQTIRLIKNKDYKNDAVVAFFKHCETFSQFSKSDLVKLTKLRNKVKNSYVLCSLNTSLINISSKISSDCTSQIESFKSNIEKHWSDIDGHWHKIDVAFTIHNSVLNCDREFANSYKQKAISLRESSSVYDEEVVDSHIYTIDLAIRCLYFASKYNCDYSNEFKQIKSLINNVPSTILRLKLYSRMASIFYLNNKVDDFNDVTEKFILQDIELLGSNYTKEYAVGLYLCAPILFRYSRDIFQRKLDVVQEDQHLSDLIIEETQRFLLNKVILNDPYKPVKNPKYKIPAKELEEHLYLVKKIQEDYRILFSLQKIVNVLVKGRKANEFTKSQIELVASETRNIIDDKFDNQDYIKHDGYKICCEGLILKLKAEKNNGPWNNLFDQCNKIPVLSDRIIIIGELIDSMPHSLLSKKKEFLRKAVDIAESLSSDLEKISRYEYLVEIGQEVDLPFVKGFVKKAVLLSTAEDNPVYDEKRLSLINSIFSMDEEFAAGLSAAVDNDPARQKAIQENVERKKQQKKEQEELDFANEDIGSFSISKKYPQMFWNLLGQLNAANHFPDKHANYSELLKNISNYQVSGSYPILSYYIHALGTVTTNKMQMDKIMMPMLRSFVGGAVLHSSVFNFEKNENVKTQCGAISDDNQIVFGEDNVSEVTAFIKNWVSELEETNGPTEITIVDPYFCLDDLEIIAEALNNDPNFMIKILTSHKRMKLISSTNDTRAAIKQFWHNNISSTSIPFIDIVFCGVPSLGNEMPIHDRWWISNRVGLRLGGSINGISGKRISTISKMKYDDIIPIEERISGYLNRTQRQHNGERIDYEVVAI